LQAPDISVVVPAYNVGRFLGATLASLRVQTFPHWEAIVVDDGSTDDTAVVARAVAEADDRVRLVVQPNRGVSAARNAGLARASGACIMFLDGDDLLHPTALARLKTTLDAGAADEDDGPLVAAFGSVLPVQEDGSPMPGRKPVHLHRYPSGRLLGALVRENLVANGGQVLVRTAVARRAGGFDERLALSEDWEFWCRLALHGAFAYIGNDAEVLLLRVRAGSSAPRLAVDWRNHEPALRAVLGSRTIENRFGADEWRRLSQAVWASHLWEAGRINFVSRRYGEARRLMLASLRRRVTLKRLALFAIAQVQQRRGRTLVSRLRFLDETAGRPSS
jgi:glycosyltransferase involved in cell wall biosynthesis